MHLRTVLISFGPLKALLKSIYPSLPTGDWRYRHAGLMAISAVGEGCHKYMEEVLTQIVEAILPYLADPVSCVSFAVIFFRARVGVYWRTGPKVINSHNNVVFCYFVDLQFLFYFSTLVSAMLHVTQSAKCVLISHPPCKSSIIPRLSKLYVKPWTTRLIQEFR